MEGTIVNHKNTFGYSRSLAGNYVIDGWELKKDFHTLYKGPSELINLQEKSNQKKNKTDKEKKKSATVNEVSLNENIIELQSNPSLFAVYDEVRNLLLESLNRKAQNAYLISIAQLDDASTEVELEANKEALHEVPKIVYLGLVTVYELIKGSVSRYPELCVNALSSLLDILQGQEPSALEREPATVLDSLFLLLRDLSTKEPGRDSVELANLYSIACSSLLALVVAAGNTGKFLQATCDILTKSKSLSEQLIKVPVILTLLQRSAQAVLLGKTLRPEWLFCGVPRKSLSDSFYANIPSAVKSAIIADGDYLYIHNSNGLFKVGTGFGDTKKGHVYDSNRDFFTDNDGWLGCCKDNLFFRSYEDLSNLMVLDKNTFEVKDVLEWPGKLDRNSISFSDGTYLGSLTANKQGGFVVENFNTSVRPMTVANELYLLLEEGRIEAFGGSGPMAYCPSVDGTICTINAGKEFTLVTTSYGKVYFQGRGTVIGMKASRNEVEESKKSDCKRAEVVEWPEVVIAKNPRIICTAVGHEGQHAVFVTEDGVALFAGTARFKEDGEANKVRRAAKPVKPKRMVKMDGKFVVSAACNNGTTALVTKDGEIFLFGKDAFCCNSSTGLLVGLKEANITAVALGKAHVVALSHDGTVYTFGVNNKGQCGREWLSCKESGSGSVISINTNVDDYDLEDEVETGEYKPAAQHVELCPPFKHRWRREQCTICTICHECTGYGEGCVYSSKPERIPGQVCGCGSGDAGCADCGCCRVCASFDSSDEEHEAAAVGAVAAVPEADPAVFESIQVYSELPNVVVKGVHGFGVYQRERQRIRLELERAANKKRPLKEKYYRPQRPVKEEVVTSDVDKDASKLVSLDPAKVDMPTQSPITKISCGLHHTVCLCANGEVYTWGNNAYGQLGTGDLDSRGLPVLVRLPPTLKICEIAAGSNHTVLLTITGQVYTFGAFQKGQLGRAAQKYEAGEGSSRGRGIWYAVPAAIPGFGPRTGRKANWIGCSGDTTFVKLFQCLINSQNLYSFNIIANPSCLLLIPSSSRKFSKSQPETQWKNLAINRVDGTCRSHGNISQIDFSGLTVCLDSVYNVIWSYDSKSRQLKSYNVLISAANRPPVIGMEDGLRDILSPELSIPVDSDVRVSRSQAALHMLACIDVMAWAHEVGMSVVEDNLQNPTVAKAFTKEDFFCVNRFDSHGGGWGYSGHSTEAIRFMADTDVLIGGFGLFGGRGEYIGRIRLFELGVDGGECENDGIILAESEDIPYECPTRQKFPILFDEPVAIQAHKWYVAWARISGPSSDCGSCGQLMVSTDDQVLFIFKSSKRSNNGTDVNGGQIPQILYKISNNSNDAQQKSLQNTEIVPILSKSFFFSIGPGVYASLKDLLLWAWESLCVGISRFLSEKDVEESVLNFNQLVYICCSCLRLLRVYVSGTYPLPAKIDNDLDTLALAEEIFTVKNALKAMLSRVIPPLSEFNLEKEHSRKDTKLCSKMIAAVLDECHRTFVCCFHAFYPTGQLKWNGLCDLLVSRDEGSEASRGSDRLLSAFLASLCSPTVKLRATCPILSDAETELTQRPSPADNAALSTQQPGDLCRYPTLVEHITYKTEDSNATGMTWTFREVLDRLLGIVCGGVRQALREEKVLPLPSLVNNTCLFLSTVVSELTSEALALETEVSPSSKVLHATPNRYLRISQSRTWSTGNGSTDAICFTVDRPAIHIAGIGIYGGIGNYEYEIELHDQSGTQAEGARSADRWNIIEAGRGTFGSEDLVADIYEAKFCRPISIKEGMKYAIRLSNRGGRTSNGDGGISHIKGPDGTTFTFSACSLSVNGTNHIRGQIPIILYYSTQEPDNQQNTKGLAEEQAKKAVLTIVGTIIRTATELMIMGLGVGNETATKVLGSTPILSTLMPLVLAHIKQVAVQDPRSAVSVLNFIQEILPQVSALNNLSQAIKKSLSNDSSDDAYSTTSSYYALVESDHPYKPATISNYKVVLSPIVKWLVIEFDPQSSLAQFDDVLKVYIPNSEVSCKLDNDSKIVNYSDNMAYWILLEKFSSGFDIPRQSSVIPGNEVMFSLETATVYAKDDKASFYGFKAMVIGYDWPISQFDALKHLEKEVALLGGVCSASLICRDLPLPPIPGEEPEEDMEAVQQESMLIYQFHPSLLKKGFALSHPPTIYQTLDGVIPFSCHSHERLFLRDFVAFTDGTSGGRLARWLQPDSHVDPKNCTVIYSKEELRAGWPIVVTLVTRDQYGEVVYSSNMKMEIAAVPSLIGEGTTKSKLKRFSSNLPDTLTFGGKPHPSLETPYQVSIKDKVFYNAITMMKSYENYSFEEIRLASPAIRRPTESMLVRRNGDGTYTCNWTPGAAGWYTFNINIDGYPFEKVIKVHVKDPPCGTVPPQLNTVKRPPQTQSMLRKFVVKDSAGLRIRVYPTLQSEQIGIIHFSGTIAFVDEVNNDDGVWVRLSEESTRQYCEVFYAEAWCLQYNQHSGRTLLSVVEQSKSTIHTSEEAGSRHYRIGPGEATSYTVVKCGASGHSIRSKHSLKAPAVGMLVLGNAITCDGKMKNSEGSWVRLDGESCHKYCFTDGEAWSLAVSRSNTLYLQGNNEPSQQLSDSNSVEGSQKGYDFSQSIFKPFPSTSKPPFVFGMATNGQPAEIDSAVFKAHDDEDKKIRELQKVEDDGVNSQTFSLLHGWLKDETEIKKSHSPSPPVVKEIKTDFPGVSVKELVKAIGESRANGNGVTPPRTPPATPKRTSLSSSPRNFANVKSTSAIPVPGKVKPISARVSLSLSPSSGPSTLESGQREPLCDSRRPASSLPIDASVSGGTSVITFYGGKKFRSSESPGGCVVTMQIATQTSPEGATQNVGTMPCYEEAAKLSPKGSRRDRKLFRVKREKHPSVTVDKQNNPEKVKDALSPSEAECMRAVFAAFLWHEGIVHDAMACASYLKFHPDLKKQDQSCKFSLPSPRAPEPTSGKLTKEQKARQRHSVEVSAYNYLNVTVQNPEDFLKLGGNANIVESLNQEISESGPKLSEEASGNSKLTTVLEGADCGPRFELPLGLQHVLLLWEELSHSCSKAILKQIVLGSPTKDSRHLRKAVKDKDRRRRKKSGGKEGTEDDQEEGRFPCDICGHLLSSETTEFHFHLSHPGCKNPSHGCGFAFGKWKFFASEDRWAIPCGEMFKDCFHMCWLCRTKHLSCNGQKDKSKRKTGANMVPSPFSLDAHLVMRNNAMFLLDLESSATSNIVPRSNPPKRNYNSMPCVSEFSPENSPFPKVAFQCLHTLNCQQQHLNQLREDLLLQQHALNSSDPATNRSHSSSGDSKELQKEHSYSPSPSHHGSPGSESEGLSKRPFHRSVSATISHTDADWDAVGGSNETPSKQGVVYRKRNNSSCEAPGAGVSSLLAHPSVALEKLISQIVSPSDMGDYGGRGWKVVVRPIMNFIFQNNDLETLAFAMRHATRKAAARVYGMQALNWLIRSVTQPTCLHDLLWCLVDALGSETQRRAKKKQNREKVSDVDNENFILDHPLSDVTLAGDAVHPLSGTFYQLLQTVSDLMMLLPAGSPLQLMAVRCWGLNFLPADHDFLHQSHVFSNISKILSKSEEVLGANEDGTSSFQESDDKTCGRISQMVDVTRECKVRTSSRPGMVLSLTDGSTETFWESGDEDRNKVKNISIQMSPDYQHAIVYLHIDNCRDMGSKISSVHFRTGYTVDDINFLQQADIESRFAGWINCPVSNYSDNPLTVTADLRGPDQSVRVRQVRIIVTSIVDGNSEYQIKTKFYSAPTLQQKACEHETLRVFRLITGQVFGRLLNAAQNQEGIAEPDVEASTPVEGAKEVDHNNDLREHMVGILFSRPKLTHLQKQVCSHIVQALKKESKRMREEWDAKILNKLPPTPTAGEHAPAPDAYCFEMLSMVLALSGSAVGRAYLAPQENLIKHLLSLLHTGSARVQRQVVSLFRRMLADISPTTMANVMGIPKLPTLDMKLMQASVKDAENCNYEFRVGILDVFLSVISKTLTVQIKRKNQEQSGSSGGVKSTVTAVRLAGATLKRKKSSVWWLQGHAAPDLAKLIISLIRDMTNAKMSEEWAQVSKGAIAESILNLTRLGEQEKTSVERLVATPTLWFAMASLCVLHPEHTDALSSQQWQATNGDAPHPKPTCENHDDGETLAIILCAECGNLCGDCDRILHLNRVARTHQRNVFREEQQAIKVDLHEGCGRAKLFWLLALADSLTFKALIEMRDEKMRGNATSTTCRFCGSSSHSCLLSNIPVCHDADCQAHSRLACNRTLSCGHLCSGIEGERICLPCLQGCSNTPNLKQDGDDMCMICFSEALSAAPSIQLDCCHVFHAHCTRSVILKKWPGPRITFTFSQCPICKVRLKHWWLTRCMLPISTLYDDVRRKALMRLEYEGLLRSDAITTKGARYYNQPASFAMDKYAYYVCFKCKKAYYGGEVRCEVEVSDEYDPRELVCGACSDVSRAQMCPKHGQDFLEYKCRYCCSVAVFFCFGTTHFCNSCHEDFQKVTGVPKSDLPACPAGSKGVKLQGDECPLHVKHPPTGEEFALGCGVCRNAHTF